MVPPASCRGGFTVAVDLQSAAVSCCNGFVYRPLRGYRHQVLLARRHTVLLRSHVVHQRDQCLQRLGRLEELCQLLRSGDLELAVDHSEFLLRVGQGDNCVHLLLRRAHRGLHRLRQASLVRAGLVELRRQRAEGALDARMRVSMPRKASAAWFMSNSLSPSFLVSETVVPSTFFRFSASFARI